MQKIISYISASLLFSFASLGGATGASKQAVDAQTTAYSSAPSASLDRSALWEQLEDIYAQLEIILPSSEPSKNEKPNFWEAAECTQDKSELMRADALYAEAEERSGRLGISLNGYYAKHNIENNYDNNEDSNAYLGLSWDILKEGYVANAQRAKSLFHEAELVKLQSKLKLITRKSKCYQYWQGKQFNNLEAILYKLKLDLMEPVYTIERRAYFKGWSYLDDFLIAEEELFSTQRKLKRLSSAFPLHTRALLVSPPILDIDIQAIILSIQNNKSFEQLSELKKNIIEHKEKSKTRNRLRFFVRSRFEKTVDNTSDTDRDLTAGLFFSVPLERKSTASTHFKKLEIEEEKQLLKQSQQLSLETSYQAYQEKLEKAIKQQYRYIRSYERARRSFVGKRSLGESELASAIIHLRTLLNSSIALIKVKRDLYRHLVSVFSIAGIDYDNQYVYRVANENSDYRARPGNRLIYIWSSAFNSTNNQTLVDFLNTKGIKRVALSVGQKTNQQKALKFIEVARKNRIRVEVITGANNWIFPESYDQAARSVVDAAKLTGAIHLDIEPHTLPGFKKQRERYLDNYLQMLRIIRKKLPDKIITVAVPYHWPEHVYREINNLADAIYIMAYGSRSVSKIESRIQPILDAVPVNKISLVLRVDDFEDEWAIEQAFEKIGRRLGIRHFGLHQYKTFIRKVGENI
ncbi:MAG: hypothetical protein DRR42_14745 [Gammaproteobacteria bacterium]|nr:MAG: hypothetical protein DRR42_14745 [Gammaproteobacteria bacterium]